jgi:hypothetical protein
VTAVDVTFAAVRSDAHVLNVVPDGHRAPLLGAGAIELTGDGLRLRGTRARTTLPTAIGVVVGIVGVIAAAIVLVALDVSPDDLSGGKKLAFVVGLVAGVLPGVAVYRLLSARMRGGTIDVVVPWPAVRVLARPAPGAAIVRLSGFDVRGDIAITATAASGRSIIDSIGA